MHAFGHAVQLIGLELKAIERGGCIGAAAVVVRGKGVVVLRQRVVAAGHLVGVTYTVTVRIGGAGSATHAHGVELVAIAVAIARGNVGAAAFVDGTWTVADATGVDRAYAIVHIVTDAVSIGIRRAGSTTDADDVELIAIAIAVARWDIGTAALVNGPWTVADTARIDRPNTVIHIVADSVSVSICRTGSTAHAEGVELVAVAVAVAGRDIGTAAFQHRTGTVADPALIELAHAGVDIVTDAVTVGVGCTAAATHAQRIELVAVAITVAGRDVIAAALEDGTGAITNTAGIVEQAGCGRRVIEITCRKVGAPVNIVA